jgi:hypothetical protein
MTGIVFEHYVTGSGSANVPAFRSRAIDASAVPYGVGRVRFTSAAAQGPSGLGNGTTPRVRGFARDTSGIVGAGTLPKFSSFGVDSTLVPSAAIQMAALPMFYGSGTSYSVGIGNQNAKTPRVRAFATAAAPGAALARFPAIRSYAYAIAQPQSFVFAMQSPGYASIVGVGAVGGYNSVSDRFVAHETSAADFIHALMDLIQFHDVYGQTAQVLQALQDGISVADVAALIWEAGLLDEFVASAVESGTAQITVMLADTFDLSESATALSEILAAIRDGFYVAMTINTGADIYTAWVMTPETKAMRSYSNFPFNSFAKLGGHFIGAGDAGIYRIGGNTDAGAAIRSAIRTGLLNFGSQNMKAVTRAYVGATTSGVLLLRVQATTFDARTVEQTYRMVPAVTGSPREHLQEVGKGFRSVYWTFELANDADGASFEVTDWQVLPVTLPGRLI